MLIKESYTPHINIKGVRNMMREFEIERQFQYKDRYNKS